MKKITKIILGIFLASLLSTSIQAGELTVTGGANATIVSNGSDGSSGRNVGVSNELAFAASGELDNGWTWKYQTELDGTTTATDDVMLTIATQYGTVGFFSHEGDLSTEAVSVGALGAGQDYKSPMTWYYGYEIAGYGNLQYHTPAGLLPLGAAVKIGYAPNMANTAVQSAKEFTANGNENTGRGLTQVQVALAPIDGLAIKADAAQIRGQTGTSGAGGTEDGHSGNINLAYAYGPVKLGYSKGWYQPAVGSGEITYYENNNYGVSFALNEATTISFNRDTSEQNARAAVADTATRGTKTIKEAEQDTWQIAYTMGGMTIGYSMADVSNSDYTTGKNETLNILSIAMSF